MRVFSVIIITTIALCFFACNDKKEILPQVPIYEAGDTTLGYAFGLKNGVGFEAAGISTSCDSFSYYSVHLGTVTSYGALRESITFGCIFSNPQVYGFISPPTEIGSLDMEITYATVSDDGDVLEDFYVVDESMPGNMLEITTIDTVAKRVEGIFTVHMKIKPGETITNPINPEKVTFSDIEFSVTIID